MDFISVGHFDQNLAVQRLPPRPQPNWTCMPRQHHIAIFSDQPAQRVHYVFAYALSPSHMVITWRAHQYVLITRPLP
jgi:hypothetical protein